MRVLIADDDEISRKLLSAVLEMQGHEVTEASDGARAWEILRQRHFPVAVVDWLMPEMDGLELCRQLRAAPDARYTYIIMLTVRDGKADYLSAIEAGADDFLVKPADEDQLAARLHVAKRVLALQDEKQLLAELIPICSFCRSVRNDQGFWQRLEDFLATHGAHLSHGICETCFRQRYPELWAKRRGGRQTG